MCLCICHSLHHSLLSHMPHISISDTASGPWGIWVCNSCCKSQCHSWSSAFTPVSIFFIWGSPWPLSTLGAPKLHLPRFNVHVLRQKSFLPRAATHLPLWVFLFSAFSLPHFFLYLHLLALFKVKTLSAKWKKIIHSISKWNRRERVLYSAPPVGQGLEIPHKT